MLQKAEDLMYKPTDLSHDSILSVVAIYIHNQADWLSVIPEVYNT